MKKISKLLRNINFDPDLKSYKSELILKGELDNIFTLNNEFYYVFDLSTRKMYHISGNFNKLLGYDPEKLTYKFLYGIMHNQDRNIVIDITQQVLTRYFETRINNPDDYLFCIDFRLKRVDGSYIRVQKKSCVFKKDNIGNFLYKLSIIEDITDLKKNESMNAYLYNTKTLETINLLSDNCKKLSDGIFSNKQMDILDLMGKGLYSNQIAKKMNRSYHTIATHRKNMLAISGTKNAYDLLIFAKDRGYI